MKTVSISHVDNYKPVDVRRALQENFAMLGMDRENPFGASGIVKPGATVFIKPNWVASRWRESCPHRDSLYSVITHPAVIDAVIGFVATALEGRGKILLGDNPSIDADFDELMKFTGMRELGAKYGDLLKIKDLRPLICDDLRNYGKKDRMVRQAGDDLGTVEVNLGKESLLYGLDPSRFRGVFDEREDTIAAHSGDRQVYTYARSLYDADVYISIPKLKTHQKVGVTLNLKGLVGAISDKNQLVHWQVGYPEIQGDEYPDREAWEKGRTARVKHRGAWPGNDTIWRMVADLYRGMQRKERRYFSVIDGIMAGEGQGPFCPSSKFANSLVAGESLLAVDVVAARYMGFDPHKIKYLAYFLEQAQDGIRLPDIKVYEDGRELTDFFATMDSYLNFSVVDAWRGIRI